MATHDPYSDRAQQTRRRLLAVLCILVLTSGVSAFYYSAYQSDGRGAITWLNPFGHRSPTMPWPSWWQHLLFPPEPVGSSTTPPAPPGHPGQRPFAPPWQALLLAPVPKRAASHHVTPQRQASHRPVAWLGPYEGDTVAVQNACDAYIKRLLSVSDRLCLGSGYRGTGYHSANGHTLIAKAIQQNPHAPTVLLIGGIHGNALTSVSTTFLWGELFEHDPRGLNWVIVPAVDADGVLASPARRLNGHGVNLGRNLPTRDWGRQAPDRPDAFHPGPSPLSEPGSRLLVDAIRKTRPDAIVVIDGPPAGIHIDARGDTPRAIGPLKSTPRRALSGSVAAYADTTPVIHLDLAQAKTMPAPARLNMIRAAMVRYLKTRLAPDSPPS